MPILSLNVFPHSVQVKSFVALCLIKCLFTSSLVPVYLHFGHWSLMCFALLTTPCTFNMCFIMSDPVKKVSPQPLNTSWQGIWMSFRCFSMCSSKDSDERRYFPQLLQLKNKSFWPMLFSILMTHSSTFSFNWVSMFGMGSFSLTTSDSFVSSENVKCCPHMWLFKALVEENFWSHLWQTKKKPCCLFPLNTICWFSLFFHDKVFISDPLYAVCSPPQSMCEQSEINIYHHVCQWVVLYCEKGKVVKKNSRQEKRLTWSLILGEEMYYFDVL